MNKLERARQFLKKTAQSGLRVVSLAPVAGAAYGGTISTLTASAPAVTYIVTGSFDNGTPGDPLSGTITIGNGSISIMGENLSVVDGGITYNFTTVGSTATGSFNGSASYYYSDNSTSGNGAKLVLDLYTGATQGLSGYAGGPLCSDTFSCGGTVETNFTPPNIVVTGPDSVGFTPPRRDLPRSTWAAVWRHPNLRRLF